MADEIRELTPDNLWAGPARKPGTSVTATLAKGQVIERGTILTMGTDGLLKAVTAKSQSVYGIAIRDTDATAANTEIGIYIEGEFNINALKVGTVTDSSTPADYLASARNVGLIFRTDVQGA